MIIWRKRYWRNKLWIEYLFVPNENKLMLPKSLPKRYNKRIITQNDFDVEVKSLHSDIHQHITNYDLNNCKGIWLLVNDCQNNQFMNIEFLKEDSLSVINFDTQNCYDKFEHPLSLYHGTSSDLLQSCTVNLNPSDGMLGYGIYLGTFWKASRFATRDQNHTIRNGSILRYIVFPTQIIEFPRINWICHCLKCKNNNWASNVSDHETKWKLIGDAAHALPTKGLNEGSNKWVLKNEEWCVNCPILLTHTANINLNTIEPHYDPYQRNIYIQ